MSIRPYKCDPRSFVHGNIERGCDSRCAIVLSSQSIALAYASYKLLEEIFAYAGGSKKELASYSLVCRAWSWPTRPFLFKVANTDAVIHRGTQRDATMSSTASMSSAYFAKSTAYSIEQFIAFLRAHPPIAQQYQRFHLGQRPWVDPVNSIVDDTIAQCLDCTPNIRYLDANSTEAPFSKALQNSVARKLRASVVGFSMIQDVMAMPLVQAAVRDATHLVSLRISVRDRLTPIRGVKASADSPRPSIRSLDVGPATRDLPKWLVSDDSPVSLENLQELTIHETALHIASIHEPLFTAVGSSVRVLTLASWDLDFSVKFDVFSSLRLLRICGMSLRGVSASRASLLFKQLPHSPAPQLEEVELVFIPVRSIDDDERTKGVKSWQDFADVLIGPGLIGLKRIKIMVDDRAESALRANLPRAFRGRPPNSLRSAMHGEEGGAPEEPWTTAEQERKTREILRKICSKLVQHGLL
ncbi:hypothetical protein GGG16DRAFT_125853 [Schizophyllum commune]